MVKPVHGQVPVFMSFHVFVKVPAAVTLVLSGMVTSSSSTALSMQFAGLVAVAVTAVGVEAGVSVGRGVAICVGGRVDVTK